MGSWKLLKAAETFWNHFFLFNNVVFLYLFFKIYFCTSDISASEIASDWSFYEMLLQRLLKTGVGYE